MTSKSQVASNRRNAKLSTGPSDESKSRTRLNGLKHGLRAAAGRVLPGECREELEALHLRWVKTLRPRDEAEEDLVSDIVDARWMLRRTKLAQFEHLKTRIEQAGQ